MVKRDPAVRLYDIFYEIAQIAVVGNKIYVVGIHYENRRERVMKEKIVIGVIEGLKVFTGNVPLVLHPRSLIRFSMCSVEA